MSGRCDGSLVLQQNLSRLEELRAYSLLGLSYMNLLEISPLMIIPSQTALKTIKANINILKTFSVMNDLCRKI